jgi:hypothetical protein
MFGHRLDAFRRQQRAGRGCGKQELSDSSLFSGASPGGGAVAARGAPGMQTGCSRTGPRYGRAF